MGHVLHVEFESSDRPILLPFCFLLLVMLFTVWGALSLRERVYVGTAFEEMKSFSSTDPLFQLCLQITFLSRCHHLRHRKHGLSRPPAGSLKKK